MENRSSSTDIFLRFVITSAVLYALQWFIPYYLLAIGAILGGVFTAKTNDDSRNGWAITAAGVFIAIVGYISVKYWQG